MTGVQVMMPLASMIALVGPVSTYVRVLAGRSGSLAVLVTTRLASPTMVRLVCVGKTGGLFTSLTTTLKLLVALNWPSVTTVVIVLVPGPCDSSGVQLMTPLVMVIPAGGL